MLNPPQWGGRPIHRCITAGCTYTPITSKFCSTISLKSSSSLSLIASFRRSLAGFGCSTFRRHPSRHASASCESARNIEYSSRASDYPNPTHSAFATVARPQSRALINPGRYRVVQIMRIELVEGNISISRIRKMDDQTAFSDKQVKSLCQFDRT